MKNLYNTYNIRNTDQIRTAVGIFCTFDKTKLQLKEIMKSIFFKAVFLRGRESPSPNGSFFNFLIHIT